MDMDSEAKRLRATMLADSFKQALQELKNVIYDPEDEFEALKTIKNAEEALFLAYEISQMEAEYMHDKQNDQEISLLLSDALDPIGFYIDHTIQEFEPELADDAIMARDGLLFLLKKFSGLPKMDPQAAKKYAKFEETMLLDQLNTCLKNLDCDYLPIPLEKGAGYSYSRDERSASLVTNRTSASEDESISDIPPEDNDRHYQSKKHFENNSQINSVRLVESC